MFYIDEYIEEMKNCLERDWTGAGEKTSKLNEVGRIFRICVCCFLNSATVGLEMDYVIDMFLGVECSLKYNVERLRTYKSEF